MRRDFNGEILVALFAVGVLALALVFGIVLTISRNVATPAASTGTAITAAGTGTAVANDITPTLDITATSTEGSTSTAIPAADTATPSVTVTNTSEATQTQATATEAAVTVEAPTATATMTSATSQVNFGTLVTATTIVTSSATSRPTQTATTAPTSTLTASPRPSNTSTTTPSVTPSLTPSRTATVTLTKTITPLPTYTPIPTYTLIPTFTPQATYTSFPSLTPAPTLTPSRTPTRTLSPTPTLSIPTLRAVTPAPTTIAPTETRSSSGSTASAPCTRPDNWVAYIVQRGDTLFSIARQAGISVAELQRGNCLTSDRIYIGQVLAVPQGRPIGIPTTAGSVPGVPPGAGDILPGSNIVQCGEAAVQITGPRPGITVSGTISIFGSAVIPNFNFYKIEIRDEANPNWTTIFSSPIPIQGGVLGQINTAQFPSGVYWIQVTAIDNTSNYPILPCAIRLNFAN